jgi:hypothetical protein
MILDAGLWILDRRVMLLLFIQHPVPTRRDISSAQAIDYYFPKLVGLRRSFGSFTIREDKVNE